MEEGIRARHEPTVCTVAYYESPTALPPMLSEGFSLAANGFSVEALCVAESRSTQMSEWHAPGFRTKRLRIRTRHFFQSRFRGGIRNGTIAAVQYVLSYAEYVTKALSCALRSGADLYVANDLPTLPPTMLAAKLRGKPVVYRAHELYPEAHPQLPFARLWRVMDRLLVPRCDAVVTPDEYRSHIYQDEFRSKCPPLTVRNCPPYRPPIQSTRLSDELLRRGVHFSAIVLYQGLVDTMRCIEELAEATRHFDEGVVLVIVGSGFGKWSSPASVLGSYDRIIVLPKVPYDELPPLTASADIGVLLYRNNCRNNYFCAPNKVFEYMMMGVPVVAANFPGMVSLVEGEEVGLCVDPAKPAEIAAAVNRMVRDPEARVTMRANALRVSKERYNWELEFPRLWERYCGLLQSGPRFRRRTVGAAPRA